jgi:hypothetical protein
MTITREEHGALRAGRITGSIAQRIMTSSRTAWNTIARDLRNPRPFYSVEDTPNMPAPLAWGQIHEKQATARFWDRHPEYDVWDPKFLYWHDPTDRVRVRHFGYSPDRLLSRTWTDTPIGGLETKCPYDGEVHLEVLRARCVPNWCKWQIYHGMWVSDLEDWWFVSYDPRVEADGLDYFECRVIPSAQDMTRLRSTLDEFLTGFTMGQRFTPLEPDAAALDRMF